MKIASLSGIKQSLNSQQLIIVFFMLIPDLIAMALSAFTAYSTRFTGNQNYIAATSEVLQFEYRGILILIVITWAFLLIATGTYQFNHSTLVIFVGFFLRKTQSVTLIFSLKKKVKLYINQSSKNIGGN
jgi:hypothetical protein